MDFKLTIKTHGSRQFAEYEALSLSFSIRWS
jgi:hypothetical protein